jgi:hypothetical protein
MSTAHMYSTSSSACSLSVCGTQQKQWGPWSVIGVQPQTLVLHSQGSGQLYSAASSIDRATDSGWTMAGHVNACSLCECRCSRQLCSQASSVCFAQRGAESALAVAGCGM